jgi:carbon-monoxide dehydrogenase small subunit
MLEKISFNLNGKTVEVETDPSMRLIDMLRDQMKLTGTKEGCGEGECGACTVIINGKTANACLVLSAQVKGKNVVTIEGVQTGEELHPIQQAFVDVGAVQCGFCIPGMVLSAKALLDDNHKPTEQEIKRAISGNLCRCTGYKKIEKAIQIAANRINMENGYSIPKAKDGGDHE